MRGCGVEKRGTAIVGIYFLIFVVLPVSTVRADAPVKFGDPVAGLTAAEMTRFSEGRDEFEDVETPADGLGPAFNATSCATCHSSPAVGGDSNILETRFGTLDKKKFDPMVSAGG